MEARLPPQTFPADGRARLDRDTTAPWSMSMTTEGPSAVLCAGHGAASARSRDPAMAIPSAGPPSATAKGFPTHGT